MGVAYPPVAFHFSVSFDLAGISDTDFRFREVSGLAMELEEFTHNEGGENRFVYKFPVRGHYPDLVLKRGLVTSSVLADWCEDAIQNLVISPTTVWVNLLDRDHNPLRTFTFINAWPKKWNVSDLNAETSQIAVESLELAYQRYTVE